MIPVEDERGWRIGVHALVVAGFAYRVLLGSDMTSPFMFYDEMVGPGIARYITGTDVVLAGVSGRPLYGILLAPIALLTDSPAVLYRYGLVLNAALFSALAEILYLTSRRVLSYTPRQAFAAAALGSAGAATFVYSTMLLPEALFTVLATMSVPVMHRYFEQPTSYGRMLAVVAVAALLLATNERAIVCVIAMILTVVYAATVGKTSIRSSTLVVVGLLFSYVMIESVSAGLNERIYVDFGSRISGPGTILELAAQNPDLVIRSAIGTSWYLVASTLGLAVIGLFGVAWAYRQSPESRSTVVFVALMIMGAGALSAIFVSNVLLNDGRRVDAYSYGRYVEYLLPVVAMFVPMAWASVRLRTSALVASIGITAVGSLAAAQLYEDQFWYGPNAQHNISGLQWLRHVGSAFEIDMLGVPVALAVAAVLVVSLIGGRRQSVGELAIVVVIAVGVIAGSTLVRRWSEPASTYSRQSSDLALQLGEIDAHDVAVPIDQVSPLTLQLLTFWAPSADLQPLVSAGGAGDSYDWMILPDGQGLPPSLDGEATTADPATGLVLWQLTGD